IFNLYQLYNIHNNLIILMLLKLHNLVNLPQNMIILLLLLQIILNSIITNNNNTNNNNNNNNVQGVKKCESCHTSSSPEWRRGPTGHKTLCNACGLRYSRTIARENRKREQAQREQEQRQREQREREERARERAAATVMMQRVIEPYSQYRSSNATPIPIIAPGQQHLHHQTSANSSGPLQYLPSTLPPISYHRHQPQPSHHHHHNIRPTPLNHHHQHQIDLPPPSNNDRIDNKMELVRVMVIVIKYQVADK
ncbi:hypothetical protein RhiirA1_415356, partial [Rhizophagus irregularis]